MDMCLNRDCMCRYELRDCWNVHTPQVFSCFYCVEVDQKRTLSFNRSRARAYSEVNDRFCICIYIQGSYIGEWLIEHIVSN